MGPSKAEVLEAFLMIDLIHITSRTRHTCLQTIGLTATLRLTNTMGCR